MLYTKVLFLDDHMNKLLQSPCPFPTFSLVVCISWFQILKNSFLVQMLWKTLFLVTVCWETTGHWDHGRVTLPPQKKNIRKESYSNICKHANYKDDLKPYMENCLRLLIPLLHYSLQHCSPLLIPRCWTATPIIPSHLSGCQGQWKS